MLLKIKHNDKIAIGELIVLLNAYMGENYPNDVIRALSKFNNFEIISREIKENNFSYYIIKTKNKTTGFISLIEKENSINITQLYFVKGNFKNDVSELIKKLTCEKNIDNITISIPQNNKTLSDVVVGLGFYKLKDITRYIGDNIYLYEDIYCLNVHVK